MWSASTIWKKSEVPENNLHKGAIILFQKKIEHRRAEIWAVAFVELWLECLWADVDNKFVAWEVITEHKRQKVNICIIIFT